MIFASLTFIFAFLPLFFLFYYSAGRFFGIRGKNLMLFIFSLIFYAWGEPIYVLLMFYSTVLDFTCGWMIEKGELSGNKAMKRAFLAVSLIGNLGPLFFFKYLGFASLTLSSLFDLGWEMIPITLPIGISFYTFQTMSYSIDVYRGEVKAQHNIIYFGAYVVMFPQLIAGPVVRYTTVAEELDYRVETLAGFAEGLRRFIVGLGKKTVIANVMAAAADSLFAESADKLGAIGAWIAIIAYTMQIFFDFAGYSDMAIGMGRMMGFHYLENFNYPYIANSVTDFWRRWHISMSTFFRDYVYIPLGGNRVSKLKWIRNVMTVWALTGLWHGSAWNFVLWGLYFGVLLILEKTLLLRFLSKTKVVCHIYSLFLVMYGWVIFRCESVPMIGGFTKALFGGYGLWGTDRIPVFTYLQRASVNTVFFIVLACAILFSTPIVPYLKKKVAVFSKPIFGILYDCALFAIFFISTVQLALDAYNPFIYFRF